MRENKYKARRVDGGWVKGSYAFIENKAFILVNSPNKLNPSFDSYFKYEVDIETVCQFTGLSDKKGVDIYEGDKILSVALGNDHGQKGATETSTVKFWMGSFCLCLNDNDSGVPIYPFNVSSTVEVVGNIHQ